MQRSSPSIANLSAALAKAQIGLTNPEKSLVATIRLDGPGETERAFRYASLASGLEIVRKTLGEHEIATMQTTAIDQSAGIINLTTMLAHSSGEWIASDWPVCPIAETARPRRMGAALTYARRYALFTLVGLAGEDDLDAPDLATPTVQGAGLQKPKPSESHVNGGHHPPDRSPLRRDKRNPERAVLGAKASAELRDRLLAEMKEIAGADDAALWAYCNLSAKNGLTAADAQCVEDAFQMTLGRFGPPMEEADQSSLRHDADPARSNKPQRSKAINKSVLAIPEPRRVRDRDHIKFVAQQPCLICGRRPSDAHHLRFTQNRALGRKVSDEYTVPLCRGHHRELHRHGDEAGWWRVVKIDPTAAAQTFWLKTHPLPSHAENRSVEAPAD